MDPGSFIRRRGGTHAQGLDLLPCNTLLPWDYAGCDPLNLKKCEPNRYSKTNTSLLQVVCYSNETVSKIVTIIAFVPIMKKTQKDNG